MRDLKKLRYLMLPILSLVSEICLAQSNDDEDALLGLYGDEEMISIATGQKQSIAKAPAVASVITADEILRSGATDIDEALEMVPGLHVSRDHINYNPIYTFRGIYTSFNPQVLMLINGVPLTNLFHGDRNLMWGGMPVNGISRIEVIRGPGSAIYGADAFAGVINIITKTRDDIDKTEIGVRSGSYSTQDIWLLHGSTWNNLDIAFTLEYHDTDGQNQKIDADAQTNWDALFNTNASLAPGEVNLSRENVDMRLDLARNNWRFRTGLQRRRNLGNGAGLGQALDPNNRYASDRWNTDLTYHNPSVTQYWDVTAQISFLNTTQEVEKDLIIYPPGSNFGGGEFVDGVIGNPEVFEHHSRVNISAFYSGFQYHQILTGIGYHYGDLYKTKENKNFITDSSGALIPARRIIDVTDTPGVFLSEGARESYYSFIQDIWKFADDWELTAGVRIDDYSDFGSTVNPRLALVWSLRHDLTGKLLVGKAFRAPSFAETLNSGNPVALGNADLNPEQLKSYELALDFRPTDNLRYSVNIFKYDWDKIIQFIPDTDTSNNSRTAQNEGRQSGHGLELEVDWEPTPTVKILGNYAWQNSTDENNDNDSANAPKQQVYLQLEWEFLPNWHLNTHLNWIVNRKRHFGDERREIDDFRLVDLTISRRNISSHWEFSLVSKNIFNSDAREPSSFGEPTAIPNDLPLAGRHFFGVIRYRF